MRSIAKSKIGCSQISMIMNPHFPGESLTKVTELADGMFHAAYFIEGTEALKNGVVLKNGPKTYPNADL